MNCAKCGAKLKKGDIYCTVCGADVMVSDASMSSDGGTVASEDSAEETQSSLIRKRNDKRLLGVIVAAFAIVIIIAVVALQNNTPAKRLRHQLDLGARYLAELDYEQAIVSYQIAVDIDPKNEEAYVGLADAYIGMGNYDKAVDILAQGYDESRGEEIREKQVEVYMAYAEEVATDMQRSIAVLYEGFLSTSDERLQSRMEELEKSAASQVEQTGSYSDDETRSVDDDLYDGNDVTEGYFEGTEAYYYENEIDLVAREQELVDRYDGLMELVQEEHDLSIDEKTESMLEFEFKAYFSMPMQSRDALIEQYTPLVEGLDTYVQKEGGTWPLDVDGGTKNITYDGYEQFFQGSWHHTMVNHLPGWWYTSHIEGWHNFVTKMGAYTLMANYYLRMGDLEKCMEIRQQLAVYLDNEEIVSGYTVQYDDEAYGVYDGYGRILMEERESDSGTYHREYTYDEIGRLITYQELYDGENASDLRWAMQYGDDGSLSSARCQYKDYGPWIYRYEYLADDEVRITEYDEDRRTTTDLGTYQVKWGYLVRGDD